MSLTSNLRITLFIATIAVMAGFTITAGAAATTAIKVSVSLSPEVAKKTSPDDTVFIFARAASGPRMPLAIVRKQVKDLPTTVVLDDSQSMSPQMNLSSTHEIIVVARVSKSGMATVQNGDLEGTSSPMANDAKAISINIDKVLTGQKTSAAFPGYH